MTHYEPLNTAFPEDPTEKLIVRSLARLDGTALGLAIGLLAGVLIFLATNALLMKGGEVIGPNLALLGQFFVGYEVSFVGSLIGMFYGMIAGFAVGWLIAFLRNSILAAYLQVVKLRSSMSVVNDFLDNP
jgi:hypothetical protein